MPAKLRILRVCPGLNWSSAERSALRNALSLRDLGHESIFYVLRDSQLAYEASRAGITCEYHTQGEAYGPLTWGRFLGIGQIIRKYEIHMVHGYFSGSLAGLWPLCYLVREWPMVPLVVTRFSLPQRVYRGPLYRALAQRIDLCLTSGRDLGQELSLSLGLPLHKIDQEGPSVSFGRSLPVPEGQMNIGVGPTAQESDPEALISLMWSFSILLEHLRESGKPLPGLALVGPRKWDQNLLGPPLRQAARELGIEEKVQFLEGEGPSAVPSLGGWVTHEEELRSDELQDYALEALLLGVPVLMPRRGASMEFMRQFPGIGENYRPQDPRDLMAKMAMLLGHQKSYRRAVQEALPGLQDRYSPGNHSERLLDHYRRLLQKRENFLRYRGRGRPGVGPTP